MLGIFYELAACPSGTSSGHCCRCTPLLESDRQESKLHQCGVNMCEATMQHNPRMQVERLASEIVVFAFRNDNFTVLGISEGLSLRVSDSFATTL